MKLDNNQIWVILLFQFKMGHKQWKQLRTSTTHLAQKLLTNVQCSGGSRGFIKETRTLKMRRVVASHQELTMTNWMYKSKLMLLQLHEKLLKNSASAILRSCGIWSKSERWKSSVKWVPHELAQNQNIIILKHHLVLFYATTTTNRNSIGLWHVTKSGF